MTEENIYQTPQSEVKADIEADSEVRLWLPQAKMLAEQGKSEVTIRQFFKGKGIDESLVEQATQFAFQAGKKADKKGKRPYFVLGSVLIIISLGWILYTYICYQAFFWLPLILTGIGFGLINGTYLRDKK